MAKRSKLIALALSGILATTLGQVTIPAFAEPANAEGPAIEAVETSGQESAAGSVTSSFDEEGSEVVATNDQLDAATDTTVEPQGVVDPAVFEDTEVGALSGASWKRVFGETAYDTMAAIINEAGLPQGGTVIVATGAGYWDALAASGIAGLHKAPVLITEGHELSSQTRWALTKLAPSRIIVTGGTSVISDHCYEQIRAFCPDNTTRIWGQEAPDTAVEIFRAGNEWSDTAIVATSSGYWDALSIAPYSYARHAPIFLTEWNNGEQVIPQSALSALWDGGFTRVVIVGGRSVVSESVESQLASIGIVDVRRLWGLEAVNTSAEVAMWEIGEGMSASSLYVATSAGYWDALTGACLAGLNDSVLVIVARYGGTTAADAVFARCYSDIAHGVVLGGTSVISQESWDYLVGGGTLVADTSDGRIKSIIDSMSLEDKVAQLFVVTPEAIGGSEAVSSSTDFLRSRLAEHAVGGIIFLPQNIVNPKQVTGFLDDMQQSARMAHGLPLLTCVDEEGGSVSRIGSNPEFKNIDAGDMRLMGALGDEFEAEAAARRAGSYLRELGFNVDFAPVADISTGSDDYIWSRSFGMYPDVVSSMVAAQVRGFNTSLTLSCAKHFPNIGGNREDSHVERIYSYQDVDAMREWDLLPYEAAMAEGVPFIMVGHITCSEIEDADMPASICPAIVTDILRQQLGYQGIVITDAMDMGAITRYYKPDEVAVLAIEAGCDMVLEPIDYDAAYRGLLDAVRSGRISEDRINESLYRIVRTKLALG